MCLFVAEVKHGPIQVDSFAAHVKVMHTDGDYRFNQEFEVKPMIFRFLVCTLSPCMAFSHLL